MKWFKPLNETRKQEPLRIVPNEKLRLILSLGKEGSFSLRLGFRLPSFTQTMYIGTLLVNEAVLRL